jgi:hypothetical protein
VGSKLKSAASKPVPDEIGVTPRSADQPVVARVAVEEVVAVGAFHVIVAAARPDRVVAGEGEDVVVVEGAVQAIVARCSVDDGHARSLSCCCGARIDPARRSAHPAKSG